MTPVWRTVSWLLVTAATVLAVPATVMGDRRSPGVRGVKTGVTALLAAAVAIRVVVRDAAPTTTAPNAFFYLILIGIVCTVFADWLLAPAENERNFAAGLAAFLIGYLLYGIALLVRVAATATGSGAGASAGVVAIVYLSVAAVSAAQYLSLTKAPPGLRVAVIGYVAVAANLLAAGILSAIAGGGGGYGATAGALMLLGGTAAIYVSDSLIAHHLFRKPLFRSELSIMPTYYVGQVSIVAALLLM